MAAIALAGAGVDTIHVAPRAQADQRTTALLASSVTALVTLGVWSLCEAHAAPLRVMRIVDDTRRLIRAPETRFAAAEIGLDAFGQNIENRHLFAALEERAAQTGLARIAEPAVSIRSRSDGVTVKLADSEIDARLVIGADGRRSLCREAAGIAMQGRTYPQTALTLNLAHIRPHDDISTEFHTESGPFTLVPLPGRRSSLVCVLEPAVASRLKALGDDDLAQEIERRAHSLLGKMTVEPGRGMFALSIETARTFGQRRIALIGEAAHLVPPIGAQGLNLGLRDAAAIAELVADAHAVNADPGASELLSRYDDVRRADVTSRTVAVDLLNRSLLTDFIAVQGARGLALYLVDRIGPLRRAVMREGVAPTATQPRLMRGEAL
jgi:2-octaprenyl-6-methoxyphenol hydroxylase